MVMNHLYDLVQIEEVNFVIKIMMIIRMILILIIKHLKMKKNRMVNRH